MMSVPTDQLRQFSDQNSVMPRLLGVMNALEGSVGELLDTALVSDPCYEIPRRLGAILERVDRILDAVTVPGQIDTVACLRDTQALMTDISSSTEYLRTIVNAIANRPGGKKSEAAVGKKLDQLANRSFKVPINKIKHDGFELAWVTFIFESPHREVPGFAVNGLIERRQIGPASFRFGDAIAEGYSFALFLRRAFEIFYLQCDLLEQLVLDVFGAELSGQDIVAPEAGPRGLVEQIVIKLAMLPLLGFPNEAKDDVPDLVVSAGTIFVGTGRKMQFPGGACRVQTQITVRKGYTFRMPFWVPQS
jgi:hypothetical protein